MRTIISKKTVIALLLGVLIYWGTKNMGISVAIALTMWVLLALMQLILQYLSDISDSLKRLKK